MSRFFLCSAAMTVLIALSACGSQETGTKHRAKVSNRADTTEQLLVAQGDWNFVESDETLDPLKMHSSAKKQVNPANNDQKQYVPETKVASAAGLNNGNDVNFRLIRMQRHMKGLSTSEPADISVPDNMILAENEARIAAELQNYAPASGLIIDAGKTPEVPVPLQKPLYASASPKLTMVSPDVSYQGEQIKAPIASDDSRIRVNAIRFGEHPDKTRMVLDLNENASFKSKLEQGGMIVLIELPHSGWSTALQDTINHPFIRGYSVKNAPGGGSILALEMKKPVKLLGSANLPPNSQYNHHRIYLDIAAS